MRDDSNSRTSDPHDAPRDEGVVLVLTLLLTVVLATVVLALATYAMSGVSTSRVTTERTESNAAATSALTWTIEEFAKKQLVPENTSTCDSTPVTVAVPEAIVTDATVLLTCTTDAVSDGNNPQIRLVAEAVTTDGTHRTIEVLLEVPAAAYTTQVNAWIVD